MLRGLAEPTERHACVWEQHLRYDALAFEHLGAERRVPFAVARVAGLGCERLGAFLREQRTVLPGGLLPRDPRRLEGPDELVVLRAVGRLDVRLVVRGPPRCMTVARNDDWPLIRHVASPQHSFEPVSVKHPRRVCIRVEIRCRCVLPLLDHTTEAFAADPHTHLRQMREESWIVRTPNGLGVLSYAGCNALLLDPAFRPGIFEMMRRAGPDGEVVEGPRTLLGSEGGDHQDLRRVVMPWFTPRRIETLREETARLVGGLLDSVEGAGECEFMADIARRIPPTIFCWMVGCEVERGPDLAHWSAIALQAFSGDPAVMGDVREALRYLRRFADDLLEAKRDAPGDDITTALAAGVDDGLLTQADARSLLTELLERVGRQHHPLDGPRAVAPLRAPRPVGARR